MPKTTKPEWTRDEAVSALFTEAQRLQTAFWSSLTALEHATGKEIESTDDLSNYQSLEEYFDQTTK